MNECNKLIEVIKNNSILDICKWINLNCDCKICKQYNILFDLLNNNKTQILENKDFKKINLTETMENNINKELYYKKIKQTIFKKYQKI